MFILWTLIGFFSGSIMYSKIIYEKKTRQKISKIGDGNPGSSNVLRGAGLLLGLLAMALDYFKGYLPVLLALSIGGISGWEMVPVAVSPVLGHAFSPFLRMNGGKAVAVSFGIWSGLTQWVGPSIIGAFMLGFSFVINPRTDGWKVILSMCGLLIFLVIQMNTLAIFIWAINTSVLAFKHRNQLAFPIALKLRRKIK
ncbi:glycerol-3-phosphate acyltransferase [Mesotoga sp. UBA6090]|uniref:glycerol-3-phosphate acyltransferase n=1 Tax=Mesotoga sp. UBA6090 TaxID=1946860 RepID=UPI0025E081AB|nr:glycerol-3-phosphate acyltransferase [Mesotoga sp. UBA6090]